MGRLAASMILGCAVALSGDSDAAAQNPSHIFQNMLDLVQQAERQKQRERGKQISGQASPAYTVAGISLGERLNIASGRYSNFRCQPSELFLGFDWCSESREEVSTQGRYKRTSSFLHSPMGGTAYVNASFSPAHVNSASIDKEMSQRSRLLGARPKIRNMTNERRTGIIAIWGDVSLESVTEAGLKLLTQGQSAKEGILVDFLNDMALSARQQLPVYRILGGKGFVWSASYDQQGKGVIRFFSIDANALSKSPTRTATTDPSLAKPEIANPGGKEFVTSENYASAPAEQKDPRLLGSSDVAAHNKEVKELEQRQREISAKNGSLVDEDPEAKPRKSDATKQETQLPQAQAEPDELQQIVNYILAGDEYYKSQEHDSVTIVDRAKCTVDRTMLQHLPSGPPIRIRQRIFFGNAYRNRISVSPNTLSLEGKGVVVEIESLQFTKMCGNNKPECELLKMALPHAAPGTYRTFVLGVAPDAKRVIAALELLTSKYCELPTSAF